MKIIEVLSGVRSPFPKEMINRVLCNSQFGDDYMNDHSYISIKIKMENRNDFTAFLYRRLWECVYLKMDQSQYSFMIDDICTMKLSLSEVIRVINELTPPVLKNKIQEFTMSVDNMTAVLNDFLFDPNGGQFYRSMFFKICHFEPFPHTSNYDFKRTEKLSDMSCQKEICDVISSTVMLDQLINTSIDTMYDEKPWHPIRLMFVLTSNNVKKICQEIGFDYHVSSIIESKYGISIRCVADDFKTFTVDYRHHIIGKANITSDELDSLEYMNEDHGNDYILNIIRNTYKDFI